MILRQELLRGVLTRAPRAQMAGLIEQIVSRQTDPYGAAECLLAALSDLTGSPECGMISAVG
jgi:hypothetical protein